MEQPGRLCKCQTKRIIISEGRVIPASLLKRKEENMKFYSKITKQPESVMVVEKDGLKELSRKRLCQFKDGVCETLDAKIIAKLKTHPERFRTDKPWPTDFWQDTPEGKRLLKKGESLGIDIRHIRKEYLIKLITDIENEKKGIKPEDAKPKETPLKEIVDKAKSMAIPTNRRRREDILKDIENKEVIINA